MGVVAAAREADGIGGHERPDLERWSALSAKVDVDSATVRAGVDGELDTFDTPVRLHCRSKLRIVLPSGLVEREAHESGADPSLEAGAPLSGATVSSASTAEDGNTPPK